MLEEASQAQYSELYQKSYIPFIDPNLSYEEAEILEGDNSYMTGIVYEKHGKGRRWKVGNDKKMKIT